MSRRGNGRLRSSQDSVIFHRKESKLMTKMVVALACSSSDKCVARHPTLVLPLKPVLHKDSSSYSTSWLFKRIRRRRRRVTTLLHKNSSSYERERGKGNSHTTWVYDLSDSTVPWSMGVSFLCQASSLFIAQIAEEITTRGNWKGKIKGIQCSQSGNSFPMRTSGWTMGSHAVIRFLKIRSWHWRWIE
jgi:hypothetical protein